MNVNFTPSISRHMIRKLVSTIFFFCKTSISLSNNNPKILNWLLTNSRHHLSMIQDAFYSVKAPSFHLVTISRFMKSAFFLWYSYCIMHLKCCFCCCLFSTSHVKDELRLCFWFVIKQESQFQPWSLVFLQRACPGQSYIVLGYTHL